MFCAHAFHKRKSWDHRAYRNMKFIAIVRYKKATGFNLAIAIGRQLRCPVTHSIIWLIIPRRFSFAAILYFHSAAAGYLKARLHRVLSLCNSSNRSRMRRKFIALMNTRFAILISRFRICNNKTVNAKLMAALNRIFTYAKNSHKSAHGASRRYRPQSVLSSNTIYFCAHTMSKNSPPFVRHEINFSATIAELPQPQPCLKLKQTHLKIDHFEIPLSTVSNRAS